MAEEAGYLTFDQVADQLGIFIWRDSPSGPIEVFPDSPTDRRKIEDLLAVLEDAGIRLLREGDYCFGYLPPKPWLDAANDDDEADKDDNAFESTAWQENAVRAMEGD
jgi:hypothetical protein